LDAGNQYHCLGEDQEVGDDVRDADEVAPCELETPLSFLSMTRSRRAESDVGGGEKTPLTSSKHWPFQISQVCGTAHWKAEPKIVTVAQT
jgi:hypothetical protein